MVYEKDLEPIVSQDAPEGDTPETPETPEAPESSAFVSQEDAPEGETPETPAEGGSEGESGSEE